VAAARNPLLSFLITTVAAAGLSGGASLGALLLPYAEFRLFYLGLVLFAMGFLAGRASYIGFMSFAGGYVGGFWGVYVFRQLVWYLEWYWFWPIAAGMAFSCGLGCFLSSKLMGQRLDREIQAAPRTRRCQRCGAKVGIGARKCWDCNAPLSI